MSTNTSLRTTPHRSFGVATNLLSSIEVHHRTLILSLRTEHLNLCALAEEYNTLIAVVAPGSDPIALIKPPCFQSTEVVPHSSSTTASAPKQALLDSLLGLILTGAPPSSHPRGYGPETLDEQAALLPPPPMRKPLPSTSHLIQRVFSDLGASYLHSLEGADPPPEVTLCGSECEEGGAGTTGSDPRIDAYVLLQRMLSVENDSGVVLDTLTPSAFLLLLPLLVNWLGKVDPVDNGSNPNVRRLYHALLPSSSDAQYARFSEQVFINAAFILLHESISMFTTTSENSDSADFLRTKSARRDWRLITAALANIEENDDLMSNFKWRDSVGHLRMFILAAANL